MAEMTNYQRGLASANIAADKPKKHKQQFLLGSKEATLAVVGLVVTYPVVKGK